MLEQQKNIYRERVDYSKIKTTFPLPDLLEIQKKSYEEFLQIDLLPEERKDVGLQAAFKDVFPITDFKETTELQFLSYTIGDWQCKCGRLKGVENARPRCLSCGALLPSKVALNEKQVCPYCGESKKIELPLCDYCGDKVSLKIKYSPLECIQKGYTYEAPLKLKVQLVSWEKDPTTKTTGAAMAAPVVMAGGAAPQAEAKPAEEKTSFNVVLKDVGSQKIQVIKVVREVTNLGLKEAKDFVDSVPKVLKENVSKEEAESIKAKFAEVGATVEIQ